MSTSRTIVIGDIHACFEELQDLLDLISFTENDELISIGDLVDRGPYPKEVVTFFMKQENAHAIMGNHEDKHIRIFDGELDPSYSQIICRDQLGSFYKTAIEYFRTLPLFLRRHDFWLVHAGLLPNIPPNQQPRNTLLRGRMPWMSSNYDKSHGGWWRHYTGTDSVVYGHSVFHDVHIENNTYGLDTGVCHGQRLSAMILETRQIIQIEAREDHWKKLREVMSKERGDSI
jgi:serine/threonine protein phosphatase 1